MQITAGVVLAGGGESEEPLVGTPHSTPPQHTQAHWASNGLATRQARWAGPARMGLGTGLAGTLELGFSFAYAPISVNTVQLC